MSPQHHLNGPAASLLDALLDELADRVVAKLAGATVANELVDVVRVGVGMGAFPSADAAQRACRAGLLDGATKVGRRWLAPKRAIAAYVEAHGRAPVPPPRSSSRLASTPANDAAGDPLLEVTVAAARRRGRR